MQAVVARQASLSRAIAKLDMECLAFWLHGVEKLVAGAARHVDKSARYFLVGEVGE